MVLVLYLPRVLGGPAGVIAGGVIGGTVGGAVIGGLVVGGAAGVGYGVGKTEKHDTKKEFERKEKEEQARRLRAHCDMMIHYTQPYILTIPNHPPFLFHH